MSDATPIDSLNEVVSYALIFNKKQPQTRWVHFCKKYENCMLSENVHDRSFRLDKKFLLQLGTNPRFQNQNISV